MGTTTVAGAAGSGAGAMAAVAAATVATGVDQLLCHLVRTSADFCCTVVVTQALVHRCITRASCGFAAGAEASFCRAQVVA